MSSLKKLKIILSVLLFITIVSPKAKAAEECFEGYLIQRSLTSINMHKQNEAGLRDSCLK